MGHKHKPSVHLRVQGSDDVGERLPANHRGLLKRVLAHVPARAVQLAEARQNVLEQKGKGGQQQTRVEGGRGMFAFDWRIWEKTCYD